MKVIGIDIGSSSVKGAVLDLDRGTIDGVVQVPFSPPVVGLAPLHFEVDPEAVVRQFESVASQLAEAAPKAEALFCCGQMGGLVLVDRQGIAQSNYISWRDQRVLATGDAGSDQETLRTRLTDELLGRLGNEFRPGGTLNILSWLVEHRAIPSGPLLAMGLGDYVLMRLCACEPAEHPTAALGTLDLTRNDWSYEALERIGAANVRWPKLVDLSEPMGVLRLGGRTLKCFASVGDHQCALAGAGLGERELSVNISTGSQVSVRTADLRLGATYQSRPYFRGEWLNTVTHLPAGRALNALVDLLTELAPPGSDAQAGVWERIGRAIAKAPETDLSVNLAFFAGPAGNRGHIENISLENLNAGHLFRAAMKNMADNYSTAAQSLARGSKWDRLLLSGGLAQKLTGLSDLIAERFGLPYRIAASNEETMQGLLELARASPT